MIQIDWAHRRMESWDGHGAGLRTASLLTVVISDWVRDHRRMLSMNAGMGERILIWWDLGCDGDPLGGIVRSNMRLDLFHYGDVRGGARNSISK